MIWIGKKLVGIPLVVRTRRLARAFLADAVRAPEIQRARLLELVRRHASSGFGRDHRFDEIRTAADYRRRVPIRGYEGHEPYIAQVREGQTGALFGPGTEVLMFAMTSGTTARPKTIPVTRESLRAYRESWKIWGMLAFEAYPRMIQRGLRPILQLVSDWKEQTTAGGIPCGAITGLTAAMQNPLVRVAYCMPAATMGIKDVEAKYYTALRLSAYQDLGAIFAANPATLLGMARLGEREAECLIRDLRNGTLDERFAVPGPVRAALRWRIARKRPRTARRLEEALEREGRLSGRAIWPNLDFVGVWTGGTMGAYLKRFPEQFGEVPVRDIGLIASEGRFTIPIESGTPAGVIDFRHHYYEFIPEDQVDREEPETVEAADLVEGRNYYLVPTTAGGLYRYHIYDLVRCAGFYGRAPMLIFLSKGSHFSSLAGEKLSEFQVVAAVNRAAELVGLKPKGYLLLPKWGEPPSYELLIEADDLADTVEGQRLAAEVDRQLCQQNREYEDRRATRRLGPIATRRIAPGSWTEFQRRRLARSGGTAEQYKQPCLLPDLEALEQFTAVDGPSEQVKGR
ncbi:MAG: hypothetical protein KatS3mg108_3226 [Isosphaeraceae bacterium]|jgi:hypothetical protein|nr:MAG: hypothetical protein KatS3mg108_3226 [Isosphaeraceae bacterium]